MTLPVNSWSWMIIRLLSATYLLKNLMTFNDINDLIAWYKYAGTWLPAQYDINVTGSQFPRWIMT